MPSDLLSPGDYDDDASLRSPSEQESDSEDDEFLRHSRTSVELAEHDRTVLDEEDEREKLLTRSGPTHGLRRIFSPVSAGSGSVRIGKRERRRRRQERREARRREQKNEDGELMYEMEDDLGEGDDRESLLSRGSYEGEKVYYDEVGLTIFLLSRSHTDRAAPDIMDKIRANLHGNPRSIPHSPPRRIQSFFLLPSIPLSPAVAIQWHKSVRPDHHPDLP